MTDPRNALALLCAAARRVRDAREDWRGSVSDMIGARPHVSDLRAAMDAALDDLEAVRRVAETTINAADRSAP